MRGNLHHYTADTKDRVWAHIYLFALATGTAFLLFKANLNIPWWVETPSVFGFYGIFFGAFNYYLWKTWLFQKLLSTPDMSGKYRGVLKSSFDNFNTNKAIEYTIKQTWSNILIYAETDTSCSESLTASFFLRDVLKKSIVYQYQNTPRANAPQGMQIHNGFANLHFENSSTIKGDFFTGRGRTTYGTIELTRI